MRNDLYIGSVHFSTLQWFSLQSLNLVCSSKELPVTARDVEGAVVSCSQLSREAQPTRKLQLPFSFDGSQCFTHSFWLDNYNLNTLYLASSKCSGKNCNRSPWYSCFVFFIFSFLLFSKWKDWRHQWLPKK